MDDNALQTVAVGAGAAATTYVAMEAWRRHSERTVLDGKPVHSAKVDARSVSADPETFQFKSGGDSRGVTDRLAGVKKWNPLAAGRTVVYERSDGSKVIADGHQRLGLATRLMQSGHEPINLDAVVLRERDGWSPRDVRAYAAIKNMHESSGNPLDMAKVMRERPDLVTSTLPMTDAKVREARALSHLSEPAFKMVAAGVVEPSHAAAVGEAVRDGARHVDLLKEMADAKVKSAQHARLYVQQAMSAPTISETTGSLFGAETNVRSLLKERAAVLDRALTTLKGDRKLFSMLEREAGTIEAAGNKLVRDVNAQRADVSAQVSALVEKLATQRGPVSGMLDQAAKAVAEGKKAPDAARGFIKAVRETMSAGGIKALVGDGGTGLAVGAMQRMVEKEKGKPPAPIRTTIATNDQRVSFANLYQDGRLEIVYKRGHSEVVHGVTAEKYDAVMAREKGFGLDKALARLGVEATDAKSGLRKFDVSSSPHDLRSLKGVQIDAMLHDMALPGSGTRAQKEARIVKAMTEGGMRSLNADTVKHYAGDLPAAKKTMADLRAIRAAPAAPQADTGLPHAITTKPPRGPADQASFLPDATTKEKIAAAAKGKGKPSAAQQPMDDGLFGSSMKQTDLVEMAKAAGEGNVLRNLDRLERQGYQPFRDAAAQLGVSVDGGNAAIRDRLAKIAPDVLQKAADAAEVKARASFQGEIAKFAGQFGDMLDDAAQKRAVSAAMDEYDRAGRAADDALAKSGRPGWSDAAREASAEARAANAKPEPRGMDGLTRAERSGRVAPLAVEPVAGGSTIERFRATYEKALTEQIKANPSKYAYGVERAPEMARRMTEALATGGGDVQSPTVRAAAKALGIDPTVGGLKAALNDQPPPAPKPKAPGLSAREMGAVQRAIRSGGAVNQSLVSKATNAQLQALDDVSRAARRAQTGNGNADWSKIKAIEDWRSAIQGAARQQTSNVVTQAPTFTARPGIADADGNTWRERKDGGWSVDKSPPKAPAKDAQESGRPAQGGKARVKRSEIPGWPRDYYSDGWKVSSRPLMTPDNARFEANKLAKAAADARAALQSLHSGLANRLALAEAALAAGDKKSPYYPRVYDAWKGGKGRPMAKQDARLAIENDRRDFDKRIAEAEKKSADIESRAAQVRKAVEAYDAKKAGRNPGWSDAAREASAEVRAANAASPRDAYKAKFGYGPPDGMADDAMRRWTNSPMKVAPGQTGDPLYEDAVRKAKAQAISAKAKAETAAAKKPVGRAIEGEAVIRKLMSEGATAQSVANELRITESAARGRIKRIQSKDPGQPWGPDRKPSLPTISQAAKTAGVTDPKSQMDAVFGKTEPAKPKRTAKAKVGDAVKKTLGALGPAMIVGAGAVAFDSTRSQAQASGKSQTEANVRATGAAVVAGGTVAAIGWGINKGVQALAKVAPAAGRVVAKAIPIATLGMAAYHVGKGAIEGAKDGVTGAIKGAGTGAADFVTMGAYSHFTAPKGENGRLNADQQRQFAEANANYAAMQEAKKADAPAGGWSDQSRIAAYIARVANAGGTPENLPYGGAPRTPDKKQK